MFACPECGHRQDGAGACGRCGNDPTLDLDKRDTVDLLFDIDQRLRMRRETRIRLGSVAIAVGLILSLWTVPGYWSLRGRVYPGLPLFADQFAIMILLGLGLMKLLERRYRGVRRFPYVTDDGQLR